LALDHANANESLGPFPLVMRGGQNPGRLVVAHAISRQPTMTYSDTGGYAVPGQPFRWAPGLVLSSFFDVPASPSELLAPTVFYSQQPPQPPQFPIAGNVRVLSFPSMSVNPLNQNDLVCAFALRSEADPTDYDLFISHSANQGQSWTTYRVNESMMGLPAGSDQFLPSICFDQYGGINLLFCNSPMPDTTPHADALVTVRYARWTSVDDMIQRQIAFSQDLSQPFQPVPNFNDYQVIVSSGCVAHAVWCSKQEGQYNIYVTTIDLNPVCGTADTDGDGAVQTTDASAFLTAFGENDSLADRNRDQTVDLYDVSAFNSAYAASAAPPP
jgi:hypothetical protein